MLNPCGGEIHCLGGRQAGGTQVSHLAQAGTQAGRQAGRHACKQAGRQAALMGRKSKAGRNASLGAKDVKCLRRGNPLFGGRSRASPFPKTSDLLSQRCCSLGR